MSGARGNGDGRVLRGRRNHDAVVQALLDLIGEGALHPTAKAIAERAGLSRRSIFQHFSDMESIYDAAGDVIQLRLAPLLGDVCSDAPLPQRVHDLLALRQSLLLAMDPLARASRRQERTSPPSESSRRRLHVLMGNQCRRAFAPELARMPPAEAQLKEVALSAALSWPVWDHLRSELGYSADRVMAVMGVMVRGLLGEALSTLEVGALPGRDAYIA